MSAATKPVIFISYAHADEPEKPIDGQVQWLSFVRTYLQPAVKHGIFTLWVDRQMPGGADWNSEIEQKLRECDIFVLLVSAYSMASNYIVDREIAIIRERQAQGEPVYFYPLILTPTPKAGLEKIKDKNLRPRDATPFSGFTPHDRARHMTDAADEIAEIAAEIFEQKRTQNPSTAQVHQIFVNTTGLPETAYERLVGRQAELASLDEAWGDDSTNILSLVAEGGAGKSALVNEWLTRLQADSYRGAEAVLGWSFYSQGTKERATSADAFLNWALEKLRIKVEGASASVKAEAIAEALMKRRVLLLLDGVEPLQHGPGPLFGRLKDLGLRALLRRFATTPPGNAHGLIVLTSRLVIEDIAPWRHGAAPIRNVELLSDDAGAALLRDNSVWGTDQELKAAARDFGGHPLALGLLASFLLETQTGDVRRRDRIRTCLGNAEYPHHDHARRVMESYETEWLAGERVLLSIMHIAGLFDRPARADCLQALRKKPAIPGLTDEIVDLGDDEWQRAVFRLRDGRLLAPLDPTAVDSFDAHPLVREWFGERFRQTKEKSWKAAHGRLYEHLRDTTHEGNAPTLEDLGPLYQAIAHGCQSGRFRQALHEIYIERICRRSPDGTLGFYASHKLGARSSNLAAISWFFDQPYEVVTQWLDYTDQYWVLAQAAVALGALGRFGEAGQAYRSVLSADVAMGHWINASITAGNLSTYYLLSGEVETAVVTAAESVEYADRTGDQLSMITNRSAQATALHDRGRLVEAEALFAEAERIQQRWQPHYPLLYSEQGYRFCDLMLSKGKWDDVRDRAITIGRWEAESSAPSLLDRALRRLCLCRAELGLALPTLHNEKSPSNIPSKQSTIDFDGAIDSLRSTGNIDLLPRGLLARAAFRRSIGDWDGATRDLDEVVEIAQWVPMRLYLCDTALERARIVLARSVAFAPLAHLVGDSVPTLPDGARCKTLYDEAAKQLVIAADLIEKCRYHSRDRQLAELQGVLSGEHTFASLIPRV